MANDVDHARTRLRRAVAAERARLAGNQEGEAPPAPLAPVATPVRPGARPGLRIPRVRAVTAQDDEAAEPSQPPPGEADDVDAAARALDEAEHAANEAYLKWLGGWLLRIVTAVALGAAWYSTQPCRADDLRCHAGLVPVGGAERARVLTPLIVVAIILLLSWTHRRSGGLRAFLIGKDGRFSTSATQALMWTFAIAYALLFLVVSTGWPSPAPRAGGPPVITRSNPAVPAPGKAANPFDEVDVSYLLLLGGPFAAAGLARASIGRKVEEGEAQKVASSSTTPTDALTNDDREASLPDIQFFVFNLVALAYFVGKFAGDSTQLPTMPIELVGLTSVAALAYAGTKLAERNAPVVTTITRKAGAGPIRAGDTVIISGANFLPPGSKADQHVVSLRVRFGTRDVRVTTDLAGAITADTITVNVPTDVVAPSIDVSVVTPAGVQSVAYALPIAEDRAVITGITNLPVKPGRTHVVTGRFFTRVGFKDKPSVTFDGIPGTVDAYDDKHITVVAPVGVTEPDAVVVVRAAAATVTSDAATVPAEAEAKA